MDKQHNNQEKPSLDPALIFLELRRRKIRQASIARELKRTQGAISQALNGDNPKLLERIQKLINRRDQKAARQQEVRTRKVA